MYHITIGQTFGLIGDQMQPWGLTDNPVYIKIFDLYTEGFSVLQIVRQLGLPEKAVVKTIRSAQFKADIKLLNDDAEYEDLCDPLKRILRLQHMAIDVMVDEMQNPRSKFRFAAACDVLDRGGKIPRHTRVENLAPQVPADQLAFVGTVLRELGEGLAQGAIAGGMKAAKAPPEERDAIRATVSREGPTVHCVGAIEP